MTCCPYFLIPPAAFVLLVTAVCVADPQSINPEWLWHLAASGSHLVSMPCNQLLLRSPPSILSCSLFSFWRCCIDDCVLHPIQRQTNVSHPAYIVGSGRTVSNMMWTGSGRICSAVGGTRTNSCSTFHLLRHSCLISETAQCGHVFSLFTGHRCKHAQAGRDKRESLFQSW